LRTLLEVADLTDRCAAVTPLKRLRKERGTKHRHAPLIAAELLRASAACASAGTPEAGRPAPSTRADVPAGRFLRGSTDTDIAIGIRICRDTYFKPDNCTASWFEAESPQRSIHIDRFLIDQYEVTNLRYRACVAAGACAPVRWAECVKFDLASRSWSTSAPGHKDARSPQHPVVCTTWDQAQTFCAWSGGRLPTEAEWEKAARGTDGRPFPWGKEWNETSLNWGDLSPNGSFGSSDGASGATPAGSYPASVSPYGAHDMAGNVWEWTQDWYTTDFYAHSGDENPVNRTPAPADGRIVRGGSWSFAGNGARAAYRYYQAPDTLDDAIGFRCAYDP
jgi:formylglycine-generating enzyme required for sulfatase activity